MRLALVQIQAGSDKADNLSRSVAAVRDAAAQGATLIVLPEATSQAFDSGPLLENAESLNGPFSRGLASVAEELGVTVVAGMFRPADHGRVYNTALVTGPRIHAGYDKIHLFDTGTYKESETVAPGSGLFTFAHEDALIGVATCFDIRFPDHFLNLAKAGCSVVLVPTSWADGPGKLEQWKVLTRARALDAGVFIIAVDQARPGGTAHAGQESGPTGIGHSVAVAPDGTVLAQAGWGPELLIVDIDPAEAEKQRKAMPLISTVSRFQASDFYVEAQ